MKKLLFLFILLSLWPTTVLADRPYTPPSETWVPYNQWERGTRILAHTGDNGITYYNTTNDWGEPDVPQWIRQHEFRHWYRAQELYGSYPPYAQEFGTNVTFRCTEEMYAYGGTTAWGWHYDCKDWRRQAANDTNW